MSDILNKQIVLSLNKNWQPIGVKTVRRAVEDMCSLGPDGSAPFLGMDITMAIDENGENVVVNTRIVGWDEWIDLEVRDYDLAIQSARQVVRVPTVIICANYAKIPMLRPRLSNGNIYERDGGICQYTGKKLSRHQASIDHVHPKSRGGKDVWENLVLADKQVNTMKADKFPHEVGLKLIRQPKAPPALPITATFTAENARHESWKYFLVH